MSSSNVQRHFVNLLGEQCNMEVELTSVWNSFYPFGVYRTWLIGPSSLALSKSNSPLRRIARRSLPLGIVVSITFRDDGCQSSLVWFNVRVFLEGVGSLARSLSHTSSGSMGPSAPCGASGWSRRMGLLHMGHTLRISSHLSRHLKGRRQENGKCTVFV